MSVVARTRDITARVMSHPADRIDPTMRGTAWRRLNRLASTLQVRDRLTGVLPTRREFVRRVLRRLQPGTADTLLFLDVDRLRPANDALGLEAIDEVLIAIARSLGRAAELLRRIRTDVAAQFCAERSRIRDKSPHLRDAALLTLSAGAARRADASESLAMRRPTLRHRLVRSEGCRGATSCVGPDPDGANTRISLRMQFKDRGVPQFLRGALSISDRLIRRQSINIQKDRP